MMRETTLSVIVDGIHRQGAGNLGLTLVSASDEPLPAFKAGAHIDLHLRDGLVRQYSIASSPAQRDAYVICVRRTDGSRGGSQHVHASLRVGDALQISCPRNLFELQPARRHVLMAGGIGITPLLSMAEALDAQGTPFELHYYVTSRRDVAFAKRLASGFAHGQVSIYSNDEGHGSNVALPQCLHAPDDCTQIYLCGPDGFMSSITATALQIGWAPDRIHREAFGASRAAATSGAPAEHFEVRLACSARSFNVYPHESIADVLADAGVSVPVSCGIGVCGACLTSVVSGTVDHRDSVQSESEKCAERQSIALCCSRSLSPVLVIDL